MKKNNFGFSFIEIIIISSIFIIITITGISSFNRNFEKNALNIEINNIKNLINNLDNEIGKSITDYEIYFNVGNFKYYYLENNFYKDIKLKIDLNGNTGSITTNDVSLNNLLLKIFLNEKNIANNIISSTGIFNYNFNEFGNYEINGYYQNKELNKIKINNFSNFDEKKIINLINIVDEDGNSYSGIIIKNYMGGKKEFYNNSGNIIDKEKIILFFENNKSMQSNLELTK